MATALEVMVVVGIGIGGGGWGGGDVGGMVTVYTEVTTAAVGKRGNCGSNDRVKYSSNQTPTAGSGQDVLETSLTHQLSVCSVNSPISC